MRTVLTERGRTRVEPAPRQLQPPLVRVLAGGEQVLWYSERDGRGHLTCTRPLPARWSTR
ncbi:hypothetical protein STENM327S_05157 [Streptomyces tendae]